MVAVRDGAGVAGAALVIIAAGLWATVGVAVDLVPAANNLPPEALGMARTLLAGPVVLALAARQGSGIAPALRRIDPAKLAGFAVAGVIFQICLFRAFDLLGVTLTVFLTVCLPPMIAALWSFLRGGMMGRGEFFALVLAMAGLGLCVAGQSLTAPESARIEGLSLALLASVAFVWMSDCARSLSRKAPSMLVAGLGLMLSGLIFCLILPFTAKHDTPLWASLAGDASLMALVVYLAIVPTALAYVCYCAGMAHCRSVTVGLTASMVEPAIAAMLAFLLLGEWLTLGEAGGCLLLGLAMLALMRSGPTKAIKTAPRAPTQPAKV